MNDLSVRMEGVSKRYDHFLLDHISFELPRAASWDSSAPMERGSPPRSAS
jgi:hypothetical protein